METLVERGCGVDVHQATVVACLLIVRKDGKVQKQVRTFGTFRNKGESGIFGEGRYAVLTCAYFHTSACRTMYSEVHLFESLEEAQNYKDGLDDFGRSHGTGSTDTYCHAATKGLCSGNHLLVDLAKPS